MIHTRQCHGYMSSWEVLLKGFRFVAANPCCHHKFGIRGSSRSYTLYEDVLKTRRSRVHEGVIGNINDLVPRCSAPQAEIQAIWILHKARWDLSSHGNVARVCCDSNGTRSLRTAIRTIHWVCRALRRVRRRHTGRRPRRPLYWS